MKGVNDLWDYTDLLETLLKIRIGMHGMDE